MSTAQNFHNLVTNAFPKVMGVFTSIETVQDGFHPATTKYRARLSGKGMQSEVKAEGVSPEEVVVSAKRLYATERRRFDTAQVLSECYRLSNWALDEHEEVVESMREKLMRCPLSAFQAIAATCRKESQKLGEQSQHAA